MENHYITSLSGWNKIYPEFKKDAEVDETKIYEVGLDIEYISEANQKESYDKGDWVKVKGKCLPCIISLATQNISVVINLCQLKLLPNSLVKILESENWIKSGVGINHDMEILQKAYQLQRVFGIIELKILASRSGIKYPSLEKMYQSLIGETTKHKGNTTSDWSQDLSINQIRYAHRDAIMSYQLYQTIMKSTFEKFNKITIGDIMLPESKEIKKETDTEDYISLVNLYCQKNKIAFPKYLTISQTGSSHQPEFTVQGNHTILQSEIYGIGSSIQKAKKEAAKKLYLYLSTLK